jgi:hypothetical protein
MTPTKKLELDPYYSTREYLSDVFNNIDSNNLTRAKKLIEDAKIFDTKFYNDEFPNFEEVSLMYQEVGNLKEAKNILLDAQKNSTVFYKRGYLDLIEINKKLGKEEENKKIILEAMSKERDSFLNYGYKKLIEILIEEKKYKSALKVLEAARRYQINQMEDFKLIAFDNLPEIRKLNYFPDLEDYSLRLQIEEKLRIDSNN